MKILNKGVPLWKRLLNKIRRYPNSPLRKEPIEKRLRADGYTN